MSRLKKDNKRVAEYSVTTNFYWHKNIYGRNRKVFSVSQFMSRDNLLNEAPAPRPKKANEIVADRGRGPAGPGPVGLAVGWEDPGREILRGKCVLVICFYFESTTQANTCSAAINLSDLAFKGKTYSGYFKLKRWIIIKKNPM